MSIPPTYKVDQVVYLENRYSSNKLSEVKVTRVGHKWVHLSDGSKVVKDTRRAVVWTGNTGRVFLSKEEYEESKNLKAAWTEFRKFVERNWEPPDDVTADDIMYAMKALKQEKT